MATEPESGRIFHLALNSDWDAAVVAGEYRVSTIGRSLEQDGFLHASYPHQVEGVRQRYYADVTEPLLLLTIDRAQVGVPVVDEVPDGAAEAFPHIYGPLPVAAVIDVHPIAGEG